MLLTGAGLLLRSFQGLMRVDAGFDITNIISAGLPISEKKIPGPRPVERAVSRDRRRGRRAAGQWRRPA